MEPNYDQRLSEISQQLSDGKTPPAVTARTFINWFGAQRRTSWNVYFIRSRLKAFQLLTSPDFEYTYLDADIAFFQDAQESDLEQEDRLVTGVYDDPTYRIGKLASANNPPVSVAPDDTISKAVTLMIAHDYSQLPVMTSTRDVKGIVNWTGLGSRLALGMECNYVRECMIPHKEISSDTYIFTAVEAIATDQYVLIRNSENVISGIVTTSDISLQFRQLGEPFLLLGEIENYIRRMISNKFNKEELIAVCDPSDSGRNVESVSDLTFGGYHRLLENPNNWNKLSISIDREVFIKNLEEIRLIRNDVMHFDPDGIADEDLSKLRIFVNLMQTIARVGVI